MKINRRGLGCFLVAAAVAVFVTPGMAAEALGQPEKKTVLEVGGTIENTNADGVAKFDMEMLEAIGTVKFVTTTPWFEGPVEFEGVRLDKLMEAVGAKGTEIEAVALNDYKATVPMEDFGLHQPILATKINGERMSVRDKGPLFVVYPYDQKPDELKQHKYYSRSVWQVYRIVVR